MELSDKARRIMGHLAMTKGDAFLFGKRNSDAPLTLVDNMEMAENRIRVDSMPLIDRDTVEQLVSAGYLEHDGETTESLNVAFRISDKGRALFLIST